MILIGPSSDHPMLNIHIGPCEPKRFGNSGSHVNATKNQRALIPQVSSCKKIAGTSSEQEVRVEIHHREQNLSKMTLKTVRKNLLL